MEGRGTEDPGASGLAGRVVVVGRCCRQAWSGRRVVFQDSAGERSDRCGAHMATVPSHQALGAADGGGAVPIWPLNSTCQFWVHVVLSKSSVAGRIPSCSGRVRRDRVN